MKDNENTEIGEVLARLRKAQNKSQDHVAFVCNISRKTMSNLERTEHFPNLLTFGKYAKALDMKPSKLLEELEENSNFLLLIDQDTNDLD
ncbi:helix-turn-helix domain-containing protein [Neobacillus niacini]|uniref:helix-turn-helix domain-containing protein n=1 Tax=Neobacillus niacini TaxID=86668 RepID=UPI001C8D22CB|nr:helix-turn-helix transcriptional regulator [Neobacillus niacini]MBY0145089.1 helix-turn-helix transcriptional regulator [Neobacillus niacini]